jgi:hypothetical protein
MALLAAFLASCSRADEVRPHLRAASVVFYGPTTVVVPIAVLSNVDQLGGVGLIVQRSG